MRSSRYPTRKQPFVSVILELTADRDGYTADVTSDKSETRVDEVFVSPESGIYHWRKECLGGDYRDYFSIARLSASPARIQFELNDSLRFEKPGRYSVRFTTHRVSPARTPVEYQPSIPLTTNEVSFDLEPMSAADEEKEVKRLSDLIDAARDWQTQDKYARELYGLIHAKAWKLSPERIKELQQSCITKLCSQNFPK
jgi:hypothetical protein